MQLFGAPTHPYEEIIIEHIPGDTVLQRGEEWDSTCVSPCYIPLSLLLYDYGYDTYRAHPAPT